MTNFIKSIYISTYTTLLAVVTVHSLFELSEAGLNSAWSGILLAVVPSLLFFVRLFAAPIPRTSARLHAMPAFALVGTVIALAMASSEPQTFYALLYGSGLGIGGSLLYIYWYSSLGRSDSQALVTGQPLPEFSLKSTSGDNWQSRELANHPALLLFYRGNWCPLCMAQIKEVAAHYQQLEKMGVKVYLVSPQPEAHTQSLANKFNVNYHFMVDENNQAAKRLGIDATHGTPKGLEVLGYDSDTVLPTAIITDNEGKIIFTDQTDNYRVRPEPDTFIKVFEAHGIQAT